MQFAVSCRDSVTQHAWGRHVTTAQPSHRNAQQLIFPNATNFLVKRIKYNSDDVSKHNSFYSVA
jgi:hypothetical protein